MQEVVSTYCVGELGNLMDVWNQAVTIGRRKGGRSWRETFCMLHSQEASPIQGARHVHRRCHLHRWILLIERGVCFPTHEAGVTVAMLLRLCAFYKRGFYNTVSCVQMIMTAPWRQHLALLVRNFYSLRAFLQCSFPVHFESRSSNIMWFPQNFTNPSFSWCEMRDIGGPQVLLLHSRAALQQLIV